MTGLLRCRGEMNHEPLQPHSNRFFPTAKRASPISEEGLPIVGLQSRRPLRAPGKVNGTAYRKSKASAMDVPVNLPQDIDALAITTEKGTIYIDLAEQVDNMVLMRPWRYQRVGGRAAPLSSPWNQDVL